MKGPSNAPAEHQGNKDMPQESKEHGCTANKSRDR